MKVPDTRYAKSENVYVAYQVFGEGEINFVFVPGWTSHLDFWWDEPACASWLRRFGRFARVIMFDKRGTGLSDRVDELPTMDERMDDIRAVMDATETQHAAIYGWSEGGHSRRCSRHPIQAAVRRSSCAVHLPSSAPGFPPMKLWTALWRTSENSGEVVPTR